YGLEFLIKKDLGHWNGWIGYTLSWSKRYFDELNGGDPFFSKYDRRHNLSVVQNLKLSKTWSFGGVWTFSSGARFTPQTGLFGMPNAGLTGVDWIPVYSKRNSVSMSSSHRLDVNFVWKSKDLEKFRGEWHFGAYNVYNRATPWRIEVEEDGNGGFKYVQPGLFGFIPSVAYNFEF
ncbi:TonB-dependent receptor, partial [Flavobacteriales bacterium]|nr:TonB-dependent receptor [Flavobacteriales bacterium]